MDDDVSAEVWINLHFLLEECADSKILGTKARAQLWSLSYITVREFLSKNPDIASALGVLGHQTKKAAGLARTIVCGMPNLNYNYNSCDELWR